MRLKLGFKPSDAGIIPEDWNAESLLGISSLLMDYRGRTPKKLGMTWGGGDIPALSARNVKKGFIDFEEECYLGSTNLYKRWMTHGDVACGDIVITTEAPLGNVARIPDSRKYILSQRTVLLRPNPTRAVDAFLSQLMLSEQFQSLLAEVASGSTATGIKRATLEKIVVALPPLLEQRAIANTLSEVDALLDALDMLTAKKRDLKKAAMQQLLVGRTRLPGFSGTWGVKLIGELAAVDPENLPSNTASDYAFHYISLEQVDSGRLLGVSEQVFGTSPSRARRVLRHDDVLMSTVRPNLKAHLHFRSQVVDAVCSTGFAVLRARRGALSPGYLFAHLFGDVVNQQIERILAGSNYPAVNGSDVRKIAIPCPPTFEEQAAIAAVLSDMDAEIEALEARRAKTHDLKQAMMQVLLTGRVRFLQTQAPTVQIDAAPVSAKKHNWAINEAVVIAVLAKHFGSERYPLGRKRYTKLSYLLHRHVEGRADGYLKKAAGPYNPQTRYGGPEKIAIKNGYVQKHTAPEGYSGIIAAGHIAQAEGYFEQWYRPGAIEWLEQFRRRTNDDLEALTTVDMAAEELRASGKPVDVAAVKDLIRNHPEWEAKLDRPAFSDANINKAIQQSDILFGSGCP